ncbi:MAG: sigma-70 family RNA polymerase sigma factor, partial [Pseudomonadota bacterium]|nr:sigma-70 family RNA polymerase sigma factor [Pseudomonadota bacterium]
MVKRMRAGERGAFDEFFKSSAPRLVAFIARRSAFDRAILEDIVQGALIKAVRNLASYRGEAALFTWLTEIARHELADAHRKAARQPAHVRLDELDSIARRGEQLRAPQDQEPISLLDAAGRRAEVMKVLQSLPSHYALALEAKYGDGLSVEAIARQLGLSGIATQSVLARARDAFRQRWLERSAEADRGDSTHD